VLAVAKHYSFDILFPPNIKLRLTLANVFPAKLPLPIFDAYIPLI
jgi:hypothetical protein